MTDVVEIARSRRARLLSEVAKLEDFISMAETLLKLEQDPDHARGWLTGGNGAAATGTDAASEAAEAEEDAPEAKQQAAGKEGADLSGAAEAEVMISDGGAREADGAGTVDAGDAETESFLFAQQGAAEDDELVLTSEEKAEEARLDAAVGQKLRQRRWMMGMTKKQLAERVGVDVKVIQNYELGLAHVSTKEMWQLAAALDVPTSYFFEETAEPAAGGAETAEPALARTA